MSQSSLGLEGLGDLSALLQQPSGQAAPSGPLELALDLIDEDPGQPRTTFDPESLDELAATIALRGVKTPISVRPNPETEGRYIVNHGARRLRASRLAGKATIPAFVDTDYTEADQVIENLQRDALTAREIADFIGRELAKGKKKSEIAKELGKANSFVTLHINLLDMPELIGQAFSDGRITDVTVVAELMRAYEKWPLAVESWMERPNQEFSRSSVRQLRASLEESEKSAKQDAELEERELLSIAEQEPEPAFAAQAADARDPDTIDAFTGRSDSEAASSEGWGEEEEIESGQANEPAETEDMDDESLWATERADSDPAPRSAQPPRHEREPAADQGDSGSQGEQPLEEDTFSPTAQQLSDVAIIVAAEGRAGILLYQRRATQPGCAWVDFGDGDEDEIPLIDIQITQIVEKK